MFGNVDDAGDLDADYLDEVGTEFTPCLLFRNLLFLFCVFCSVYFIWLRLADDA
jgi:hypothetical protein